MLHANDEKGKEKQQKEYKIQIQKASELLDKKKSTNI